MVKYSQFYFIILIVPVIFLNGQEVQMERQMLIESYHPCSSDRDCSINSICVGNTVENPGLCNCNKGYVIQRNRTFYECLKEAKHMNDSCKLDIQCQVKFDSKAVCSDGLCTCKRGSHFYDNFCWKTVRLNGVCEVNQNCLLKDGSFASCADGKCACENLEHPVYDPNGDNCVKNVKLGDHCTIDDECMTENSRCIGVCRCKPGYTTNHEGEKCIKAANEIGDECFDDIQCEIIENSECRNGNCDCVRKYHSIHNACYKDADLGERCSDRSECEINSDYVNRTECLNSVCQCKSGFTQDGKLCKSSGYTRKATQISIIAVFIYLINY